MIMQYALDQKECFRFWHLGILGYLNESYQSSILNPKI